jgi:hypothetical protein
MLTHSFSTNSRHKGSDFRYAPLKNARKHAYPLDLGLSSKPRTSSRATDLIPCIDQFHTEGLEENLPSAAMITSALCTSPLLSVREGSSSS